MFREIIHLIRPQNGLVIASSFAMGWLWFAPSSSVSWSTFWLSVALVYLVHSAQTIKNDIVDRETDRINMPERPLVSGSISLFQAEALFFGLLLLAFACVMLLGKIFFFWGVVLYFVGWLYNEPPFLGSHRPVYSILLLALYFTTLPVLFGAYAAVGNHFSFSIPMVIAIIGLSLSRAATSIFKDFKDVVGDAATGKKTFLLRFGPNITTRSGFLLAIVGGVLIVSGTISAKGSGFEMLPTILFLCLGIYYRLSVVRDTSKGTLMFPSIYSNEIRLQLAYILWLIWS